MIEAIKKTSLAGFALVLGQHICLPAAHADEATKFVPHVAPIWIPPGEEVRFALSYAPGVFLAFSRSGASSDARVDLWGCNSQEDHPQSFILPDAGRPVVVYEMEGTGRNKSGCEIHIIMLFTDSDSVSGARAVKVFQWQFSHGRFLYLEPYGVVFPTD